MKTSTQILKNGTFLGSYVLNLPVPVRKSLIRIGQQIRKVQAILWRVVEIELLSHLCLFSGQYVTLSTPSRVQFLFHRDKLYTLKRPIYPGVRYETLSGLS